MNPTDFGNPPLNAVGEVEVEMPPPVAVYVLPDPGCARDDARAVSVIGDGDLGRPDRPDHRIVRLVGPDERVAISVQERFVVGLRRPDVHAVALPDRPRLIRESLLGVGVDSHDPEPVGD
jgi:hypothetical protein